MKPRILLHAALYAILVLQIEAAQGQVPHFSQFQSIGQWLNPSLNNTNEADAQWAIAMRSQWERVPVPYRTLAASYQQKVLPYPALSVGGMVLADQAGDAAMSWLLLAPKVSWQLLQTPQHRLALGASATAGQRRLRADRLTFDEQFVDGVLLSTAPTGESAWKTTVFFGDIAAGIHWQLHPADRLQFTLGGSVAHLLRPRIGFMTDTRLLTKWTVHAQGSIQLSPALQWLPAMYFAQQGSYQERVFGAAFRLRTHPASLTALEMGAWYRMNDAAIASLGITTKDWYAALSYDINTSPFAVATRSRGAVELSWSIRLHKVKPIPVKMICPII